MIIKTIFMETSLGDVTISGSPGAVDEVAKRCNSHDTLHTILKQLEWSDVGKAFSVAYGGDITVNRCPICNHSREYYAGQHAEDCKLAALIREGNQ